MIPSHFKHVAITAFVAMLASLLHAKNANYISNLKQSGDMIVRSVHECRFYDVWSGKAEFTKRMVNFDQVNSQISQAKHRSGAPRQRYYEMINRIRIRKNDQNTPNRVYANVLLFKHSEGGCADERRAEFLT